MQPPQAPPVLMKEPTHIVRRGASGAVAAGAALIVLIWAAGDFAETHDGPMWPVYAIIVLLTRGAQALGSRRGWPFAAASLFAAALWLIVGVTEPSASPGVLTYVLLVSFTWGVLEIVNAIMHSLRPNTLNAAPSNLSPRSHVAPPSTPAPVPMIEDEPPLTYCYHCGATLEVARDDCATCGKTL